MLSVYCSKDEKNSVSSTGKLHTLTKDWDYKKVTWDNATGSVKWSTPGGDKSFNVVLEKKFASNESGKWVDFTVTQAVKQFITSPEKNFGFLLIPTGSADDVLNFESSESSQQDKRPKLKITYTATSVKTHDVSAIAVNNVKIMPNMLVISMPSAARRTISLIEMNGSTVLKAASSKQQVRLDTAHMPAGMYILTVTEGAQVYKRKTVIQ